MSKRFFMTVAVGSEVRNRYVQINRQIPERAGGRNVRSFSRGGNGAIRLSHCEENVSSGETQRTTTSVGNTFCQCFGLASIVTNLVLMISITLAHRGIFISDVAPEAMGSNSSSNRLLKAYFTGCPDVA